MGSLAALQLYNSEFQTKELLMLSAFADNYSAIQGKQSNSLSSNCW